jgi:uncharacterized membrane protein
VAVQQVRAQRFFKRWMVVACALLVSAVVPPDLPAEFYLLWERYGIAAISAGCHRWLALLWLVGAIVFYVSWLAWLQQDHRRPERCERVQPAPR